MSLPATAWPFVRLALGASGPGVAGPALKDALPREPDEGRELQRAWALALFVWAAVSAAFLLAMWAQLRLSLVSQDDAMRLVELRAFLNGGSWFDLTEPRLGFSPGYLTHWSRLIDAPLAGLVQLLSLVMGPALGEDAARAVWPLLLLLPALLSITAISRSIGGRAAALRAPLFAATCAGGLMLFRPGFIHHHNAQTALALAFVALSLAGPRSRAAAICAGVLGATALAVGLESLAVLGAAAAGYALRYAADPEEGRNFGAFGIAAALSAVAVFAATVPPRLWVATQCDAYAMNMLVGTAVAGLGAGVMAWCGRRLTLRFRIAALAVLGMAALVAYVLADPSCVRGPFGHIDPEIWPLWLDHVAEMRSLPRFIMDEPVLAILFAAWPVAGLAALPLLWRRNRKPESLALGATLIVASIVAALHIRGLIYANWLAVPVVAVASGLLRGGRGLPVERGFRLRPLTFLLASLLILLGGLGFALRRDAGASPAAQAKEEDERSCSRISDYVDLARLPSGLVLSHVDLGPYILATTAHRVVAGPYHRLQKELVFARRVMAQDASSAEEALRQAGIDYIVDCRNQADAAEVGPSSLRTALMSGHTPAFLEPLGSGTSSPVLVWRVRR